MYKKLSPAKIAELITEDINENAGLMPGAVPGGEPVNPVTGHKATPPGVAQFGPCSSGGCDNFADWNADVGGYLCDSCRQNGASQPPAVPGPAQNMTPNTVPPLPPQGSAL